MSYQFEPQTIVDCKDAAESAGLSYASTDDRGLTRRRAGKGFSYRGPDGKNITDKSVLARAPDPACLAKIGIPLQIRQGKQARVSSLSGAVPAVYWRDGRLWLTWGIIATIPLVGAIWLPSCPDAVAEKLGASSSLWPRWRGAI